jgi:o-succinylbenzoate synthase
MKIASVKYKPFNRLFRKPFITSRGNITERTGWIIRISGEDGTNGFGEAGSNLYDTDSLEQMGVVLKDVSDAFEEADIPEAPATIDEIIGEIDMNINPAIRFGIEAAICDVVARIAQKPLCEWLGQKQRDEIPVNYLISGPVNDWRKFKDRISAGDYRAVKIKVASGSMKEDVKTVEKLRDELGPDIAIRLDANRGWSFDEAVEVLSRMKVFDIEYIEEPLNTYNPGRLKALRKVTGIKMALDESLAEFDDIKSALPDRISDVIIFKPAVIGGIIKTHEIFGLAKSSGHQTVITSNLETEIGIAAQLHLAAALPGELLPCGLDTLRLFEGADASLSEVDNGKMRLPEGNGIGIGNEIWNRL